MMLFFNAQLRVVIAVFASRPVGSLRPLLYILKLVLFEFTDFTSLLGMATRWVQVFVEIAYCKYKE